MGLGGVPRAPSAAGVGRGRGRARTPRWWAPNGGGRRGGPSRVARVPARSLSLLGLPPGQRRRGGGRGRAERGASRPRARTRRGGTSRGAGRGTAGARTSGIAGRRARLRAARRGRRRRPGRRRRRRARAAVLVRARARVEGGRGRDEARGANRVRRLARRVGAAGRGGADARRRDARPERGRALVAEGVVLRLARGPRGGRDRFAPSSPPEDRASRSMAYRDRPRASSGPARASTAGGVGAGGRARRGLARRPREAWPLIKTRATPAGNNILKMSSPLHNCCVVLRPEETAVRGAEGARRRKGPLRSFIALSRYSYTARRRALASAPLSHPRTSERPPRVGSTPRRRAGRFL